jgi:hypothetical protein
MSVRFKFKNDLDYQAVPCDGFNISVRDLKRNIIRQKRLGRVTDFDLLVTNSQSGKIYKDETELIPKNTTLTVQRAPLPEGKKKTWEDESLLPLTLPTSSSSSSSSGLIPGLDTAALDSGTEEDRISKMMSHSGEMYDQKHWTKYRGRNAFPAGAKPPPYWRCSRCQGNHWIADCPNTTDIKKTTGIPRSFLTPSDKSVLGAKVNPQGTEAYLVTVVGVSYGLFGVHSGIGSMVDLILNKLIGNKEISLKQVSKRPVHFKWVNKIRPCIWEIMIALVWKFSSFLAGIQPYDNFACSGWINGHN